MLAPYQTRGVVVRASAPLSKHVSQEFIVNQFAEHPEASGEANIIKITKLAHREALRAPQGPPRDHIDTPDSYRDQIVKLTLFSNNHIIHCCHYSLLHYLPL